MTKRGSALYWDCGLAFAVAVAQVVGGRAANQLQDGAQPLDWLGYTLLLIGPVALLLRRREPLAVLLVTLAAAGIHLALDYGYGPVFLSPVIAFLTAAVLGSRWWTYPLVPFSYALMIWPMPALLDRPTDAWQQWGLLGWLAVLVAVAEGIRSRRALTEARAERDLALRDEEQTRRERQVGDLRLAITRESHDLLAQALSRINVQSSVAAELFDRRPQQGATALATISTASKDALGESHALLESLRTGAIVAAVAEEPVIATATVNEKPPADRDGDARNGLPLGAGSTIEDLEGLLQRTRAAGVEVDTRVIGTPVKLPEVLDEAAARIVRDSLANVVDHAPGARATVTLRYSAESVDLTIDNTRPTEKSKGGSGGRNGIIGMRDRAHALGGQLTAGPRPSGGFRVAARLPTRLMVGADSGARTDPSR